MPSYRDEKRQAIPSKSFWSPLWINSPWSIFCLCTFSTPTSCLFVAFASQLIIHIFISFKPWVPWRQQSQLPLLGSSHPLVFNTLQGSSITVFEWTNNSMNLQINEPMEPQTNLPDLPSHISWIRNSPISHLLVLKHSSWFQGPSKHKTSWYTGHFLFQIYLPSR